MCFLKRTENYIRHLPEIFYGITRATVIDLCRQLDIPVEEKLFTIEDMKQADAAFFCGTAAEVIGWQSLDDHPFNKNWNDSLGAIIQKAYKNLVTGYQLPETSNRQQATNLAWQS